MEDIIMSIQGAIRTLLMYICEVVYYLIVFFFNIFNKLGTAEVLSDSTVQSIYEKIGLILGLFMVFRIFFSCVQYVIDPDLLTNKQKGAFNIVKKVITVIVLLGVTPSLFKFAYRVQNHIVEENVIANIFNAGSNDMDDSGHNLAWYTFSAFYKFDNRVPITEYNKCPEIGRDIDESILAKEFKSNTSLKFAYNCLDDTYQYKGSSSGDNVETKIFLIDFNGILAVVVGCLVLWMIFTYTIQVGVRVIQLAYLQLVAPVPIILYLDPKSDDKLTNYLKQCTSTYLDFFIRTAIIYFVVFLIDLLTSEDSSIFKNSLGNINGIEYAYIVIVMIIALLIFAKKVPNLLKELFPSLGGSGKFDFGLKPSKEMKSVLGVGTGALAGGTVGLIGGGLKGFSGGIVKGAVSGAKGKKISEITTARAAQNVRNRQIRDSGSTFSGRMDARLRNAFGLESSSGMIDRQIHDIDVNDIRPIDEKINQINNNPIWETKRSNDVVIGARKAMIDEAEKELLKTGGSDLLRDMKTRVDYLKRNVGNRDNVTGSIIDGSLIRTVEDHYKSVLDSESASWIDANVNSNGVLITNMRKISNEVGRNVNSASAAKKANEDAKDSNKGIISTITNLEFEKQALEREKKTFEDKKNKLNKEKEIPQANENAIKK